MVKLLITCNNILQAKNGTFCSIDPSKVSNFWGNFIAQNISTRNVRMITLLKSQSSGCTCINIYNMLTSTVTPCVYSDRSIAGTPGTHPPVWNF